MDIKTTQHGVIIGRFQTPELHSEHIKLIQYVLDRHEKVILFLGVSPTLANKKYPMDFITRKYMIEEQFGISKLTIMPLSDNKSNEKVVVCHIPPGNPENAHEIVISSNAVPAHLAHGDKLGPCSCTCNDE